MPEFQTSKYVRVMCDYYADGIWDSNGAACDVSELPVTQDVQDRVLAWQVNYDQNDWYTEPTEDWTKAHMEEGHKIALEIKRQLPDWTVKLYNEGYMNLPTDDRGNIEITNDMIVNDRSAFKEMLDDALTAANELNALLDAWGNSMEEAKINRHVAMKRQLDNLLLRKPVNVSMHVDGAEPQHRLLS